MRLGIHEAGLGKRVREALVEAKCRKLFLQLGRHPAPGIDAAGNVMHHLIREPGRTVHTALDFRKNVVPIRDCIGQRQAVMCVSGAVQQPQRLNHIVKGRRWRRAEDCPKLRRAQFRHTLRLSRSDSFQHLPDGEYSRTAGYSRIGLQARSASGLRPASA